ncbi:MAG: metallopeptidase family protein [Angustibacter sp.]
MVARPRHRDRRGRGLRGSLLPPGVPGHRSRREQFGDHVLDSVRRLEGRWSRELTDVEFAVEDVPSPDLPAWEAGSVPLGRLLPAADGLPTRVVVYRRPVEIRADDQAATAALVHEVIVEQVAGLLGMDPAQVDPGGP